MILTGISIPANADQVGFEVKAELRKMAQESVNIKRFETHIVLEEGAVFSTDDLRHGTYSENGLGVRLYFTEGPLNDGLRTLLISITVFEKDGETVTILAEPRLIAEMGQFAKITVGNSEEGEYVLQVKPSKVKDQ